MSLKIYTDQKSIKDNKIIDDVNLFFNKEMNDTDIDESDIQFMRLIDHASYEGDGKITTPFGTTFIQNLSTGCKALILINHYKDTIVNVSECGPNVLDYVLKMDDIQIFMGFYLAPNDYDYDKKVTVYRNNRSGNMTLRQFYNGFWGW